MVVWEKKFETGVKDVDDQHQSLFNYINDLEECIKNGVYNGARLQIILNFFQMFCATHFSLEETCMLLKNCPAGEINMKAHGKFLDYFKKFRERYTDSEKKKELLIQFHGFLVKWLGNHIMKIDMQLRKPVLKTA